MIMKNDPFLKSIFTRIFNAQYKFKKHHIFSVPKHIVQDTRMKFESEFTA